VCESIAARRLFIALARAHGCESGPMLASALRVARSTISRAGDVPAQWLEAASLCLSDARLIAPVADAVSMPWAVAAAAGLRGRAVAKVVG